MARASREKPMILDHEPTFDLLRRLRKGRMPLEILSDLEFREDFRDPTSELPNEGPCFSVPRGGPLGRFRRTTPRDCPDTKMAEFPRLKSIAHLNRLVSLSPP